RPSPLRPTRPLIAVRISSSSKGAPSAGISPPSLHDALPIYRARQQLGHRQAQRRRAPDELHPVIEKKNDAEGGDHVVKLVWGARSEEHTSELQSLTNLVCRLLLAKKNAAGRG